MNDHVIISEGKIANICEGPSEKNYIEMLLDNGKLRFSREQVLYEELLTGPYRKGDKFANEYLTMNHSDPIDVFLIQDRDTPFKIPNHYSDKVGRKLIFITAPEIEMLLIHHLKLFDEYSKVKSNIKPSNFLSEKLKKKTKLIKSKQFIEEQFTPDTLCDAIRTYSSKSDKKKLKKDVFHLAALLA